jgi:hypothetical protein
VIVFNSVVVFALTTKSMIYRLKSVIVDIEAIIQLLVEIQNFIYIVRMSVFINANLSSATTTECASKNVHSGFLIVIMECVQIVL